MTTVSLNHMAEAMQVHPRTVLRYLHNDRNYGWDEGDNPDVSVEKVAKAFDCKASTLKRALEGRDELLKPAEAAKEVGVQHIRSFWKQNHKPVIRIGGVTRFSRLDMVNWLFANRI